MISFFGTIVLYTDKEKIKTPGAEVLISKRPAHKEHKNLRNWDSGLEWYF